MESSYLLMQVPLSARDEPWKVYGQFCQTMLFPLFLAAHTGLSVNSLLRGFGIEGVDAKTTRKLLGIRKVFRRGVMIHVFVQSLLQELSTGWGDAWHRQSISSKVTLKLISGLRSIVESLSPQNRSLWSTYMQRNFYSIEATVREEQIITKWFSGLPFKPRITLDIGCNTGAFSKISFYYSDLVICTDRDTVCVDFVNTERSKNILGLVVDFADSTPATGWRLNERLSFISRVKPDVTIALALVHHLALGRGISLDQVVDALLETVPVLMIEFVSAEDVMARTPMLQRVSERADYNLDAFLAAIARARAHVECVEPLGPTRSIYLTRKHS